MKKLLLLILLLCPQLAEAQSQRNPCYNTDLANGNQNCIPVGTSDPLPVSVLGYPSGVDAVTGLGSGTTGAVVGTLAAVSGKTTYICGADISAIGGTAAVGPIVIAGTLGGSLTYQMSSTAAGVTMSRTFSPCIPASAANTAITVTTTANGTATAVNVNSWGYQK